MIASGLYIKSSLVASYKLHLLIPLVVYPPGHAV